MYQPMFNTVLVEIDDEDAQWGGGNDEAMLGKSYHKGTFVGGQQIALYPSDKYPLAYDALQNIARSLDAMHGKAILWNEGAEAGTLFEEDGKLYGFIYWWDIRGVKE